MIARRWHLTVAVLVVLAVLLQLWIAYRVPATPPAAAVGTLRGTSLPGRVVRVLSFFTVQSNLLAGLSAATLAVDAARDGAVWRVLRVDALFGITLTGIVYALVLARVHEPHGWQETSTNAVLHYAVPVMTVLGWLVFGPRPRVTGRVVLLALAWPLAWLAYTLVHGETSGWYPYGFVDVASHGYARVVANMVVVVVVSAGMLVLLRWADRRLPAAPREARQLPSPA